MKKMIPLLFFCFLVGNLMAQSGNLSTSLHGTRIGKETFYNGTTEHPGAHAIVGVDINDLGCKGCHPGDMAYQNGTTFTTEDYNPLSCFNCHDAAMQVAQPDACKDCHGRLAKMDMLGINDIHRTDYNMTCTDCHSSEDIHGDGHAYTNMFDEVDGDYPIDADCADCHSGNNAPPANAAHNQHGDDIHCSTCHTAQVISCYNCHFNQMVDSHVKTANTLLKGFTMIGRRTGSKYNGKIWPVSFQSVYYKTPTGQDSTFFTIVPFYSHNVVPASEAKTCSDCHNNPNVQAYNNTGELYIAKWNDTDKKIEAIQGIVPIPEDFATAFKMDFLEQDLNDQSWHYVGENQADLTQNMGYIQPLTAAEMTALSAPQGINDSPTVVKGYSLSQNYPNPFNPTTTIEFVLPEAGKISLLIYNVLGETVSTIYKDVQLNAGSHTVEFNAGNLPSGIYLYRLQNEKISISRKMVLMK